MRLHLFFFSVGKDCPVFLPKHQSNKKFGHCTTWELLNLRIDDICELTDSVVAWIHANSGSGKTEEEIKQQVNAALEAS